MIGESWKPYKLSDLADMCLGKMLDQKKNKGEFYPYLANINVQWGKIDLENLREMKFKSTEFIRYGLNIGDIVMCEGGEPGRCAIWKGERNTMMIQKALHRIRAKSIVDNQFLYYSLLYKGLYGYFEGYFTGSAIKHLTGESLSKIVIKIPNIKTQKKIASILSAYDDLIENNLKRIKLLEEQAQLTYEEWFVRMKFPGHENTPIDKETGLPEGWGKGKLSDLIGFQSGFAYKSSRFRTKGFAIIKIKNIDKNSVQTSNTNFIDMQYAMETKKFELNSKDLLIAMTGATVGKVGFFPITNKPCYLNQRVGRFLKKSEVDNRILIGCFFTIGEGLSHILNIAGGAAQPNISATQILSININIPPNVILQKFNSSLSINLSVILNLQNQNQHLKEARDLLLPRLMKGMIDVE